MKSIQIVILALLGSILSSCSVGYSSPRRGPCGPGGFPGYGMPPGYGGYGQQVGNPWARNYIPGNVRRDGRYYDQRRMANEVHFPGLHAFDQNFGGGLAYGGPSYGGGQRFSPSGRTVKCPGCGAQIRNAPSGRFPCQKPGCGHWVNN